MSGSTSRCPWLPLLALLCALAPLRAWAAEPLLIANARVIDPAQRREYTASLRIENGVLVEIIEQAPASFAGTVVDLSGKYVIPGLVDAHIHSGKNAAPVGDPDEMISFERTARLLLYCGVTSYLDLGSDQKRVFAVRRKLRERAIRGADLYAVGPVFLEGTRKAAGDGALFVSSPEDARRQLDALAAKKPDAVKLIFDWSSERRTMSEPVMRALLARARELGLRTVVHIGTWENARLAIDAGAYAITHLADTDDLPEDLASEMAAKKVFAIPTMAVQADFLDILENHAILDSPLLGAVTSAAHRERYRALDPVAYADCPTCLWQREGRKHYPISLQRMQKAGVHMVAGSDTGNLGVFQGFSLHRELLQLERGGLSRWEALESATTRAYELLGLQMGLRPGAEATLVVLDASPLEDLANTQRIARVMQRGAWVDREKLLAE